MERRYGRRPVAFGMAIGALAATGAGAPTRHARAAASGGGTALFGTDRDGCLHRLDPLTLADLRWPRRNRGLPFATAQGEAPPIWVGSADGSTLVGVAPGLDRGRRTVVEVAVFDPETGRERGRIEVSLRFAPNAARLSADGRRLVLRDLDVASRDLGDQVDAGLRSFWRVIDTATGQELTAVRSSRPAPHPEYDGGALQVWAIDPSAVRLYRLVAGTRPVGDSLAPVELVAFDLIQGRRVGSLAVPTALGGRTVRTHSVDGEPVSVEAIAVPSLAISPDGSELAVVLADGQSIALVDAAGLAVKRTVLLAPAAATPVVPPARAEGAWERLGRLFSGTVQEAAYAADGRHLYRWGSGSVVAADGRQVERGVVLERVDLATGAAVKRANLGTYADVVPSPDARNLYVFRSDIVCNEQGCGPESEGLVRLDAATLATVGGPRTDRYPPIVAVATDA